MLKRLLQIFQKVVMILTKVFSLFDRPRSSFVSSGTDIKKEYIEDYDNETGEKYLREVGKKSMIDFIQASKPGQDIYSLIKAHQINVDTDNLIINTHIDDFTQLPRTLMEAQDVLLNSERVFSQLPLEVRQSFDNNVNAFISGIGTGKTVEKLGQYYQRHAVKPAKVTTEVKSGE